jgi:hypothetical protein
VIEVPEGADLDIRSTLVIDGFHVVLRSTGTGATLDGGSARRVVHVTGGGRLTLDKVHLAHGSVDDSSGGCGLVEGAGSELHVINAHVNDCRSRGPVVTTFGNTVYSGAAVEAGGGGGVAALDGAHLEVVDSTVSGCSAGNTGGAVLVSSGGSGVLTRTRLAENHADAGGGAIMVILGGAAHVSESTVTLNTVGDPTRDLKYGTSVGAGVYAHTNVSTALALKHSTRIYRPQTDDFRPVLPGRAVRRFHDDLQQHGFEWGGWGRRVEDLGAHGDH